MVHSDESDKSFSDRLRQAMENAGYGNYGAAARLARILEVTPKAVSKWLNGESTPAQDRMLDLARLLGVKAEWLLWGDEKEPWDADKEILGPPRTARRQLSYSVPVDGFVDYIDPGLTVEAKDVAALDLDDFDPRMSELRISFKDANGGSRNFSFKPCFALEGDHTADNHIQQVLLKALASDLEDIQAMFRKGKLTKISLEFEEPLTHRAKAETILRNRREP